MTLSNQDLAQVLRAVSAQWRQYLGGLGLGFSSYLEGEADELGAEAQPCQSQPPPIPSGKTTTINLGAGSGTAAENTAATPQCSVLRPPQPAPILVGTLSVLLGAEAAASTRAGEERADALADRLLGKHEEPIPGPPQPGDVVLSRIGFESKVLYCGKRQLFLLYDSGAEDTIPLTEVKRILSRPPLPPCPDGHGEPLIQLWRGGVWTVYCPDAECRNYVRARTRTQAVAVEAAWTVLSSTVTTSPEVQPTIKSWRPPLPWPM